MIKNWQFKYIIMFLISLLFFYTSIALNVYNLFSSFKLIIIFFINYLLIFLFIIICVLLKVAFLTLMERKIMASIQLRKGPNKVGFLGLGQAIADGLKLLLKENIFPQKSNLFLFIFSPISIFFLSLLNWTIIDFNKNCVLIELNLGILFFLIVSSLNIYGMIGAGWSSNSRYAFLGALRSCAQMLAYELVLSLVLMDVFVCCGSLNINELVIAQDVTIWYGIALFPMFIMFFIAALAETNRPPFDLPEAEAELVSGYNVEYSALSFAYFFLAEYSYILLMSNLMVIIFLGGWLPIINNIMIPGFLWYSIKLIIILYIFVWIRATLPRYRYDQLMLFGWKVMFPITFSWLIFGIGALIYFDGLPPTCSGKL